MLRSKAMPASVKSLCFWSCCLWEIRIDVLLFLSSPGLVTVTGCSQIYIHKAGPVMTAILCEWDLTLQPCTPDWDLKIQKVPSYSAGETEKALCKYPLIQCEHLEYFQRRLVISSQTKQRIDGNDEMELSERLWLEHGLTFESNGKKISLKAQSPLLCSTFT